MLIQSISRKGNEASEAVPRQDDGEASRQGRNFEDWADEVRRLAAARNAVILAHNYQVPWVQDVADFVGDSLALSRLAAASDAGTIVFCGVHFMAETAKLLAPDRTVLLPDLAAGCSLADTITAGDVLGWRAEHPGGNGRRLRQHLRSGESRVRHLLHIFQRRRGGPDHSRKTGRSFSCPTCSSAST